VTLGISGRALPSTALFAAFSIPWHCQLFRIAWLALRADGSMQANCLLTAITRFDAGHLSVIEICQHLVVNAMVVQHWSQAIGVSAEKFEFH
jgi:hypothetical protein